MYCGNIQHAVVLEQNLRESLGDSHYEAVSSLDKGYELWEEHFESMLVIRKRNPVDQPILTVGVSWGNHIHTMCTKVRKILGLLYRTFYHDASVTSLLKLYVSLIRPILEYACQVWNPHLVKDVEKFKYLH